MKRSKERRLVILTILIALTGAVFTGWLAITRQDARVLNIITCLTFLAALAGLLHALYHEAV